MQLPITPENFAAVLIAGGTGASAVLTAIGGWALWKKQKEPPPVGSPDALTLELVKLTKSMEVMGNQFGNNLSMFEATIKLVERVTHDIDEMRRLSQQCEQHLAAIRDATNRRTR